MHAEGLLDGELSPDILDSRGFIYLMMGEFAKAKEDYDTIFDRDARFAYALLGGGIAYVNTGDIAEGLALIEEGMELFAEEDEEVDPAAEVNPQLASLMAMAEALVAEHRDAAGSD